MRKRGNEETRKRGNEKRPEYRLLRAYLQSGGTLASIYTRSTHNLDLYPCPAILPIYT